MANEQKGRGALVRMVTERSCNYGDDSPSHEDLHEEMMVSVPYWLLIWRKAFLATFFEAFIESIKGKIRGDLCEEEGDLWRGLVIYWKMMFLKTSSGELELFHRDLTSTATQFFLKIVKYMVIQPVEFMLLTTPNQFQTPRKKDTQRTAIAGKTEVGTQSVAPISLGPNE